MKLSQRKVEDLAEKLLDELMEIDGIRFQGNDAQLRAAMIEIITDELMVEDRLDAEIHQQLQAYKYEITMERVNYDELFKMRKKKLIAQRRLVL